MTTESKKTDKSTSLRPLAKLFPYIFKYKLQVALAIFFLLLAAITTLTLPMAVRRVIDHGFTGSDPALVDSYFTVLIAIAGLLAIASAYRYYFVIWIGERIVADLRNDVFANVTRLSPEFFDKSHSGEIVSRLTADTTQIKSAVGATASVALRNVILGLGALMMMIYTSPRLSLIVIAAIPLIVLPIVGFGRKVRQRSRAAQNSLADATAYASESISAVRTMQAFTNGSHVRGRFSDAVDFAFDAARLAVRTRALLTGFAIFLIFASIVAVLWIGANDVLAGDMSGGTLGQFLLYAVFAGGALGAALTAYHHHKERPRTVVASDAMKGSYLGPEFQQNEIESELTTAGAKFKTLSDDKFMDKVSSALVNGKAIGWFQGRMEYGPRALGARSIIADARSTSMQKNLNLKVKFRESFRPFAPSVLHSEVGKWFQLKKESPYMLLVADVAKDRQKEVSESEKALFGIEKLNVPRSDIPAVTHVDYSARIQTVRKQTNPRYYKLISEFNKKSSCPVIVNTSFNVRGEPIVCTPRDAFRCFMATDLDILAIGNCVLEKKEQDESLKEDYAGKYELD